MFKSKIAHCLLSAYFMVMFCNLWNGGITAPCNLSWQMKKEIALYQATAKRIIKEIVYGKYKGVTYNRLINFTDKFGSRFTGTQDLQDAIDYMLDLSDENGLEEVHGEEVDVTPWVRGYESATLLEPRYQPLTILGLGFSNSTPPGGIRAQALVVNSFAELKKRSSMIKGKIVVFNQEFLNYSHSARYLLNGALIASSYGAVATLIRSVTTFSLNTPHTGLQVFNDSIPTLPSASITPEDAELLQRLQTKGEKLVIELKMEEKILPARWSKNVVGEITGSSKPKKVVLVSGHIDSWDVGQGAMDDGGGSMVTWNSLVILKALGLRAKRTIRVVLWTAEEIGLLGALQYNRTHFNETDNLDLVMEIDEGTSNPSGLLFSGLPTTKCILQEVLNLLTDINATQITSPADAGPDLTPWLLLNVPAANLMNDISRYFWYHHTKADTIETQTSADLDRATALWAVVSYVVADLSFDLPKNLTSNVPRL